jgi:hypothetical protein
VLKRADGNVLLHHFDALECGIRQTYFATELLERLIATPLPEKFGHLFTELVAHAESVRPSPSRMWDI